MTLTTKQIKDLNRACEPLNNILAGNLLGGIGYQTITSTQSNASAVTIDTSASSITGYLVQIYRSGSPVVYKTYVGGIGGSVLTLTSGSELTTGDRINYFVF